MFWIKLLTKIFIWLAAIISIYTGIMAIFTGFVTLFFVTLFVIMAAAVIDEVLRSVDDDQS